jgi:hypothetical protein
VDAVAVLNGTKVAKKLIPCLFKAMIFRAIQYFCQPQFKAFEKLAGYSE